MKRLTEQLKEDLESWHRSHGYDLVLMVEDRPDLFRVLLEEPLRFKGFALGERYSRLVRSTVERAEKSRLYRDAFSAPREETRLKDRLSIGRIVVARKQGKKA